MTMKSPPQLLVFLLVLCGPCWTHSRNRAISILADALSTRFVLVETRHPGNVGAAARALKTMGFDDLVLVRPKDPKVLNRERCKQGASGAVDILQKARVVETLAEALEKVDVWCATGMPHDMAHARPAFMTTNPSSTSSSQISSILEPSCQAPREFLKKYASFVQENMEHHEQPQSTESSTSAPQTPFPSSIAFVFGNEKVGLQPEDLQQCHVVLSIPTNPSFGSLNLASAVQLLAYDWRQELGGFPFSTNTRTMATSSASISPSEEASGH